MSKLVISALTCDRCGDESPHVPGKKINLRAARLHAKGEGWRIGKVKDYCKTCAEMIDKAVENAKSGNI